MASFPFATITQNAIANHMNSIQRYIDELEKRAQKHGKTFEIIIGISNPSFDPDEKVIFTPSPIPDAFFIKKVPIDTAA